MNQSKEQKVNKRQKPRKTVDALNVATEEEALEQVEETLEQVEDGQEVVAEESSLSNENKERAENFIQQLIQSEDNEPVLLIESVGTDEVKSLKTLSQSLDGPITNMTNADSESAKIGKGLVDLKVKVEEINPGKFDFQEGFFGRILGRITGNTAVNKYFTKFQSTKTVIKAIDRSLEEGKQTLIEDNAIFADDKKRYRETTKILNEKIQILIYTQSKIEQKVAEAKDEEQKTFLNNEVLFPLMQHITDLQQTLAVTSQGVIALDILIKNNKELIRGVKRTQNVTMTALTIGATVAGGLATQKKVLETTKEVNSVTNDIIAQNAKLLKEQGAEIQKDAASTSLDMEKLQKALSDTIDAIESVESFKASALPKMKESIATLNELNENVENKVQRIEAAEKVKIL